MEELSPGFGWEVIEFTDLLIDKQGFHGYVADQTAVVRIFDRCPDFQFPNFPKVVQQTSRHHQITVEPIVLSQHPCHGGHRNSVLQKSGAEAMVQRASSRCRSEKHFNLRVGENPEEQLVQVWIGHLLDKLDELFPQHRRINGRRTYEYLILH